VPVSWLKRKPDIPRTYPKREMPDNIWTKCDGCGEIIYRRELERSFFVCQKCGHHFRIPARTVIRFLTDPDSFDERFSNITSTDPLEFRDSKRYVDRLKSARQSSGVTEAVLCGVARLGDHRVALGVMDFSFLGGSMASAVGERLARLMLLSLDQRIPLIIVSSSGGARMQEGILSLMQMAKTCALLARLADAGIAYISVLTHPTTGGVTASFASLGDIILAEPKALIGFAGPRVIEQTINQELPAGFQRSEFLLDHGFVDRIVVRSEMRTVLLQILDYLALSGRPSGDPPKRLASTGALGEDNGRPAATRLYPETNAPPKMD
jgi:acetyl-CoA carboxylase carboxyl transferase subunit beta